MAEHNETGKKGEELAKKYLIKKGYKIIETNWHFKNDEIDIIAETDDLLIIVEVKTRSSNYFGEPEVFVTRQKQKYLIRGANAYVNYNKIDKEVRFDIITILLYQDKHKINHIEDAFYAIV
ncbi:MAG: YraN family protein [Bacteroidota bacterium]|nr:YraN family protein [Bacteroidota bacterium]